MSRALFIFGTRPEAIKLAPVIRQLRNERDTFEVRVCVTGQHRELLDQVLNIFCIRPEYDLDAMRPSQSLAQSTSRILAELEPVLKEANPDIVLVQGDTTTALCGAMAAFYAGVRVAHVEAGLRTGDMRQPFPEEMNRVVISRLAALHFAPTDTAARVLQSEHVSNDSIFVTGNSGIDAVLYIHAQLESGTAVGKVPEIDPNRKLILVTAHRRESFGPAFERICQALLSIAEREDVQLIYPVHPNPNVNGPVGKRLADHPRILLIKPVEYVSFVDLMRRAYIILTDSGGIQEEAPSLGKPVLVLREKTERPEAVTAGTVELVGTNVNRIVESTARLLDDQAEYRRRSLIHNPYGDGHTSERIAQIIREFLAHESSTTRQTT